MFPSWFKAKLSILLGDKRPKPNIHFKADRLLPQALRHQQAGRLGEAEALCSQILEASPNQFDAIHLMGVIALQRGQLTLAEALIRRSLDVKPGDIAAHYALATLLLQAKRPVEACAQLERVIRRQPDHVDALSNLGTVLRQIGRTSESVAPLKNAFALNSKSAGLCGLLAVSLLEAGDLRGARDSFLLTTTLAPEDPAAHNNLGAFLRDHGETGAAIASLTRAIELAPGLKPAHENLAAAYFETGQIEQAVAAYTRLLALPGTDAAAHHASGNALMAAGSTSKAIRQYRRATELDPERANARWALAMAQFPPIFDTPKEVAESRRRFSRAIAELTAWFTPARMALGAKAVGSTQPFYIAYQAQDNRALLAPYGLLCARLMNDSLALTRKMQPPSMSSRKLRVGFVSAHVQDHSVWNAITRGWVQYLDRSRFEVLVFHLGRQVDEETWLARKWSTSFVDTPETLVDWSQAIADAQLDALIYPEIGMHTLTTQLAAQRLAPVQAASWGHPHTTSLPTLDLFLSAELLEPPQGDAHYTEKLIRLPNLGVCVEVLAPLAAAPDLNALGLPADEPLLLCPGTPFKYSPLHDEVWATLGARLQAHGAGRLVFFRSPRTGMMQQLEQRLRRVFARNGVNFDRTVCLVPTLPREQFYGLMQRATLLLDTIGFSGFNTALQSLECGLPIVAHEGEFMRGRLASGLMRRMGLDEWVATTNQDFIDTAMRLVKDEPLRLALCQQIAQRRSRIFNDQAPVRALEQALIEAIALANAA